MNLLESTRKTLMLVGQPYYIKVSNEDRVYLIKCLAGGGEVGRVRVGSDLSDAPINLLIIKYGSRMKEL